jgi:hypothetical protein
VELEREHEDQQIKKRRERERFTNKVFSARNKDPKSPGKVFQLLIVTCSLYLTHLQLVLDLRQDTKKKKKQ